MQVTESGTFIQIDVRALLRFFDERPQDSERHASAIVAVLGEDLASGLFKRFVEIKYGGSVKTVLNAGTPATPKTGNKKGSRLDRWLIVEDCPFFERRRVVLQTEIKNSSAHAIGGKVLSMDCISEELERYRRARWADHWSVDQGRFKYDEVAKVLTRMKPPTHMDDDGGRPILIEPPIKNDEIEPLLCLWVAIHPDGKEDPLMVYNFPLAAVEGFRRVWIFSMSNYLRSLNEATVTLDMPTAAPRLGWFQRICKVG